MSTRRHFITLLGGTAPAWSVLAPFATRAQQSAMPAIGLLHTASPGAYAHLVAAFHQGLQEAGFVEGRNVVVEYRWADGRFDRLPALARDLVQRRVQLIAALGGSASPLAAKQATETIPIVFSSGEVDPINSGLAASLNRPGGNVTGVNPMTGMLTAKRLELLHQLVPQATLIGYLANSGNPNFGVHAKDVQDAARVLGVQLQTASASTESELDAAFTTLRQRGIGALFVSNDPFFFARREQIVALAARHLMPASYYTREFVEVGGLISYAASFVDAYRMAGRYAGRILRGEKAADLPILQSIKFEMVVNLKTANALGITVPQTLLVAADEVIE